MMSVRVVGAVILGVTLSSWALSAAAQTKALAIAPSIKLRYDSNPLRLNSLRSSGPRDDVRATIGVALNLNRHIGVSPVFLRGDIGYDKHTRFAFLDRARVDVTGGGSYKLLARCSISPEAQLLVEQFDIEDLGQPVGNTTVRQRYSGSFECNRPVGFLPVFNVTRAVLTNSQSVRKRANRTSIGGTAGIAYVRPSLGRIEVYASTENSERANLLNIVGGQAKTRIDRYGVLVSRAVSPIIQAKAGASLVEVAATRTAPAVHSTGWFGELRVAPVPRLVFSGTASQDVTSGVLGVAYAIQRNYAASVSFSFARNRASLNVSQSDRQYRGEDPLIFLIPRVSDRIRVAEATVSRPLFSRFSIAADVRYRKRGNGSAFYRYSAVSGGLSLGAKFDPQP